MSRSIAVIALLSGTFAAATFAAERNQEHEKYAASLWMTIQNENYRDWVNNSEPRNFHFGPRSDSVAQHYFSGAPDAKATEMDYGSVIVTEHFGGEEKEHTATTIRLRVREGYDPRNHDWYWAHYLPDGRLVATSADVNPYVRGGLIAEHVDGRVWVFAPNSPHLAKLLDGDLPADHDTLPGAGPGRITVKAPQIMIAREYVVAEPGFVTFLAGDQERQELWVFPQGHTAVADFAAQGGPADHVSWPLAGPLNLTVKSDEAATLAAYLKAKGLER